MASLDDFDKILADLMPTKPASSPAQTAPAPAPAPAKAAPKVAVEPPRPSISMPVAPVASAPTPSYQGSNASKIAELEDMLADLPVTRPKAQGLNPPTTTSTTSSYQSSSQTAAPPTQTYSAPPPRTQNNVPSPSSTPPPSASPKNNKRTASVSVSIAPSSTSALSSKDSLTCGRCNQQITGTYIEALDKNWHPEHFTCSSCQKSLKGNFFETDNGILCEECASDQIKCAECKNPITGTHLVYGDGRPVHTHCVPKTKCSRCTNPLSLGDAHVEAMDKFWHPECFACTRCMSSLGSTFVQFEENPYCQSCIHILSKERNIVFKD